MNQDSAPDESTTGQRKVLGSGMRRGRKRGGQRRSSYVSRARDPIGPLGSGIPGRPQPSAAAKNLPEDISIVVYLDTDDETVIADVLANVEMLRRLAGYGVERDVSVIRGSIFRRSWAAVRRGLWSAEVRARVAKFERVVELAEIDQLQAAYDKAEAEAVGNLLASLQEVPRACVRLGSILLVKYPTADDSSPTVIARNLSQDEIRIFEQYPEIQAKPEKTLELLTTMMIRAKSAGYDALNSPLVTGFGA